MSAMGKDVMAMNHLYLAFLEQFESKYVTQGTYKAWTISKSDERGTAHGEHHRWSGQGCSRRWGAEMGKRQPGHDTAAEGIYFTNN